jgi:hypothetical protein
MVVEDLRMVKVLEVVLSTSKLYRTWRLMVTSVWMVINLSLEEDQEAVSYCNHLILQVTDKFN